MGQPAARVGDMHTCPMVTPGVPPIPHVGGPILPPGRPTVLIGGMPAATVTNMCMCVGPPDVIVKGSMGVFICGLPAARMGDNTAHGGVIVMGFPMVLIGDVGMGSAGGGVVTPEMIYPQLQAALTGNLSESQIRDLMDQVDMLAAGLPDNQRPEIIARTSQIRELARVRTRARLASAVYDPIVPGEPNLPEGWHTATPEELRQLGVTNDMLEDSDSGFAARVYRNEGENPPYILAYRGTEGPSVMDWSTNVAQGVGMQTEQYDRAILLSNTMRNNVGPDGFDTTGHSLGGGLASAASATTGARGTTFNAAGLHHRTTERVGISDADRNTRSQRVDAYYNPNDPLNTTQDSRERILVGGASIAVVTGFPLIAVGVSGLAVDGALSQAYGNRHSVSQVREGNLIENHSMERLESGLAAQQQQQLQGLANIIGQN